MCYGVPIHKIACHLHISEIYLNEFTKIHLSLQGKGREQCMNLLVRSPHQSPSNACIRICSSFSYYSCNPHCSFKFPRPMEQKQRQVQMFRRTEREKGKSMFSYWLLQRLLMRLHMLPHNYTLFFFSSAWYLEINEW